MVGLWGTKIPKMGAEGKKTSQGETSQRCGMLGRHRGTEAGRRLCTNPVRFQCLSDAKFPSRLRGVPHGRAPTPTSTRVGFLHVLPMNRRRFHLLFAETVTYKDLCLTCLSERSIKGTDSQNGMLPPKHPRIHFSYNN